MDEKNLEIIDSEILYKVHNDDNLSAKQRSNGYKIYLLVCAFLELPLDDDQEKELKTIARPLDQDMVNMVDSEALNRKWYNQEVDEEEEDVNVEVEDEKEIEVKDIVVKPKTFMNQALDIATKGLNAWYIAGYVADGPQNPLLAAVAIIQQTTDDIIKNKNMTPENQKLINTTIYVTMLSIVQSYWAQGYIQQLNEAETVTQFIMPMALMINMLAGLGLKALKKP